MSLRDIKKKARGKLHDAMRVPMECYPDGPTGSSETVYARVNSKIDATGDLAGTSLAYAESKEVQPRLIFLVADHAPKRGHVYSVTETEAYEVDHIDPRDTITVTVVCTALSRKDAAKYSPPPEC